MRFLSPHLALFLALFPALPVSAAVPPATESEPYPSASLCSSCHEATYESWARTFHALSVIDPVFVEARERARESGGRQAESSCLVCHSPTTALSGDFDLRSPVSREGVTCSFCHSVTAVDLESTEKRFTNTPARLISAVTGEATEDHHFEQHQLMMSAEFCAGCHEWTNLLGLKVLSTYTEWRESFYAGEKITCQQCHMPKSLGSEVSAEGAKLARPTNLHFQMGGHSQDQLEAAARLDVKPRLEAAAIELEVEVTNFKAGHKLPTGIPNRKMHLRVDLFGRDGLLIDSAEKVYGRVIVDNEGNVLEDVTDQFLRGAREVSDNRIAPKETRKEHFSFPRPPGEDFILAEVSVVYEILTPYLVPPVMRFDVVKKRLPLGLTPSPKSEKTSALPSLAIIATVFIIVTLIMASLLAHRGRKRNGN